MNRLSESSEKLGYVDGKNVTFIHRFADTKYDRLPVLADELVRLKVDVIITPGSNDTDAAKNATKTIPIVFLGAGSDPVVLGLVDSLARPGGNLTGISSIASELAGKRLELLKETIPKLSRVAVLWNPQNAGSTQVWKESQPAAKELDLQLHSMAVDSADQLDSEFKEAVKARSGALVVTAGALLTTIQARIINLATKYRLPAICAGREFVANGGLMSYGSDRYRTIPARGADGRQDSERRQARRSSGGAAHEVRACDQPKDRQDSWPDDSAKRVGTDG